MNPNTASFADLLRSTVIDPGVVSSRLSPVPQLQRQQSAPGVGAVPHPRTAARADGDLPEVEGAGPTRPQGEKAITLCQPVTIKRRTPADDGSDEADVFTRFTYRPRWFVLAQTDGADLPAVETPAWDAARALAALDVIEIPFDATDGNVLGYARGRWIAVSPINPLPHKTRFHELAHVLLGHTTEGAQHDGELTPRNLRECEAEAVAMLCCAALELPVATENSVRVDAIGVADADGTLLSRCCPS